MLKEIRMALLNLHRIDGHEPIESGRFPGWELRLLYSPMGTLVLGARRKSDDRRLRYEEPCCEDREFQGALDRMLDKLGTEFLDLVPLEKAGNEIVNESKP